MKWACNIVLKLLGVLLLTAAIQTFTKRLIVFFQAVLFNDVRYEITKKVISGQ
jgi:hypothetical protein